MFKFASFAKGIFCRPYKNMAAMRINMKFFTKIGSKHSHKFYLKFAFVKSDKHGDRMKFSYYIW